MKLSSLRPDIIIAGWAFLSLIYTFDSTAQLRASERSTLTQTIDGTVITVDYSRPSRRDRDPIFGGVVHWGVVWTPGADRATRIEFSKDVTIDGNEVPAGSYSMWMAVNENQWEVALSERDSLFHVPHLVLNDDQIRFFVTPRVHAYEMETLTFLMPEIRDDGAILRMHWGTTFVDMNIVVPTTQVFTVTEQIAEIYIGKYQVDVESGMFGPHGAYSYVLDVRYEDEYLQADWDMKWDEGPWSMSFAPVSDQVFHPAGMMGGEPVSVVDYIFIEFELSADGISASFEARDASDKLTLSGTRIE